MVILFDAFIEFIFGWIFHELKQQSYRNLKRHRMQIGIGRTQTHMHTPNIETASKTGIFRMRCIALHGISSFWIVCRNELRRELRAQRYREWMTFTVLTCTWKCGAHVPGALELWCWCPGSPIPIVTTQRQTSNHSFCHISLRSIQSVSESNDIRACLRRGSILAISPCTMYIVGKARRRKFARTYSNSDNSSTANCSQKVHVHWRCADLSAPKPREQRNKREKSRNNNNNGSNRHWRWMWWARRCA